MEVDVLFNSCTCDAAQVRAKIVSVRNAKQIQRLHASSRHFHDLSVFCRAELLKRPKVAVRDHH